MSSDYFFAKVWESMHIIGTDGILYETSQSVLSIFNSAKLITNNRLIIFIQIQYDISTDGIL